MESSERLAVALRRSWVPGTDGGDVGGSLPRSGGHGAGGAGPHGEQVEPQLLDLLVHELRGPLTVINGFAEALEGPLVEEDESLLPTALGAIRRQIRSIDGMFRSLADARALDAGPLPLHREAVELGALLAEVVEDLAEVLPGRELRLLRGAQAPVVASLDRERIRQVMANLVGNADKFSPPGTPVEVRLAGSSDHAEVHVLDRGPGLPLERVEDAFRRFGRLDPRVKGNGLGLYIARGIAHAHGGDLEWRPRSGGGSDFVASFPVVGATSPDPHPVRCGTEPDSR